MVATSAQSLTTKVQKLQDSLLKFDRIEYKTRSRGSGGKIHIFQYTDGEHWTEVKQEDMSDIFNDSNELNKPC